MAEPFIGEIRMFSFNFAPAYWATCDGQLLPIAQNQVLYSLLGTTYGGNGTTTFALPDLRGRVPIHFNPTYRLGVAGGEEHHALTVPELPAHNHLVIASSTSPADQTSPVGNFWANGNVGAYSNQITATMAQNALATAGTGAGHENMAPSLVVNFCIALQGVYPPRS